MKKVFIGLTVAALLAVGAVVYAHSPGWVTDTFCPGYGSGYHMKGPGGYGGHMGWRGGYDQKYLDETADVRKELHGKRFEYFEAIRNPESDPEAVTKLEKEINELRGKLYAKAPQGKSRGFGRRCWQ